MYPASHPCESIWNSERCFFQNPHFSIHMDVLHSWTCRVPSPQTSSKWYLWRWKYYQKRLRCPDAPALAAQKLQSTCCNPKEFCFDSFFKKTLCFLDSCTVLQILHPKNTFFWTWLFCLWKKKLKNLQRFWASLQAKQNFNEELILDKAMNLSGRAKKSIDSQKLEAFCHGKTKEGNVDMVNWLFPKQIWWKMVGFSRKLLTRGFAKHIVLWYSKVVFAPFQWTPNS